MNLADEMEEYINTPILGFEIQVEDRIYDMTRN